MLFSACLCKPCLLPPDTSIVSCVSHKSSSSMKSIVHRLMSKKHINSSQDRTKKKQSIHKFDRIKGSNFLREIISCNKSRSTSKVSINYDMTILHEDELNNTSLAMIHRRKKKIPNWAQKDQLQLAIINQVYFQDKNPDDIFGSICIDHIFDIISSIDVKNNEPKPLTVSRSS